MKISRAPPGRNRLFDGYRWLRSCLASPPANFSPSLRLEVAQAHHPHDPLLQGGLRLWKIQTCLLASYLRKAQLPCRLARKYPPDTTLRTQKPVVNQQPVKDSVALKPTFLLGAQAVRPTLHAHDVPHKMHMLRKHSVNQTYSSCEEDCTRWKAHCCGLPHLFRLRIHT